MGIKKKIFYMYNYGDMRQSCPIIVFWEVVKNTPRREKQPYFNITYTELQVRNSTTITRCKERRFCTFFVYQ